jgi:P27 family predicted phage terminase small subunit
MMVQRQRKTPKAPSHLRAATRRWFNEIAETFELETHHLKLLTLAAESWDRCQEARAILDREGLTFKDRYGSPRSRPEISVERDSRLAFARLIRELGFDVATPENTRPPRIGGQR